MKTLTVSAEDYGVEIDATLVFTSFNPSGAVASLHIEDALSKRRPMTLTGSVAAYVTKKGDFMIGNWPSYVRVTKGNVSIRSEAFTLAVTR